MPPYRNMFDMRPDTQLNALASVVEYIRREALALDKQSADDILSGNMSFGAPPPPMLVEGSEGDA